MGFEARAFESGSASEIQVLYGLRRANEVRGQWSEVCARLENCRAP
jgi:hypothetical protein